jgi:hypothetical protein
MADHSLLVRLSKAIDAKQMADDDWASRFLSMLQPARTGARRVGDTPIFSSCFFDDVSN